MLFDILFQKNQKYLKLFLKRATTGCPKKNMWFKPIFEFLTLGGVFLGVKNNSKNFGNQKNIRLFSKILSKRTLFYSKSSNFLDYFGLYQLVPKNTPHLTSHTPLSDHLFKIYADFLT